MADIDIADVILKSISQELLHNGEAERFRRFLKKLSEEAEREDNRDLQLAVAVAESNFVERTKKCPKCGDGPVDMNPPDKRSNGSTWWRCPACYSEANVMRGTGDAAREVETCGDCVEMGVKEACYCCVVSRNVRRSSGACVGITRKAVKS